MVPNHKSVEQEVAVWTTLSKHNAMRDDAERWRYFLSRVGGGRDPSGRECFVIELPDLPPGVSIMKGSVAGHFTTLIDEARRK